ncbi:MAG: alanine--tRNA ligase [Bacteroidia bacterium]|nr:alanine--tRNA ligase [Bacteroidia bacterium]
MNSSQIRKIFLDFFASKGHQIVPSAPSVNRDDPTLHFTNAGMNQFKLIFTGDKAPEHPRVANTQKCIRVSGKHNDLEEVGYDTYHHTFFEMLGNWSFGDYFKPEAIAWSWELITQIYKINPEKLYVTVFGGDDSEGLASDNEAIEIWKQYLPIDRILKFSKKDNFWEMGDQGPCGPCTEIHIDLRSDEDIAKVPGHLMVNIGHPEVIEIWNIVFIQFNRKANGNLEALSKKSVDTGMGFERLCMVLQNKKSSYDSDIFLPLKTFLEETLACHYDRSEKESIAMRVVMDHIRMITFAIADGQLPSNTGAGYVIRRILRRASRYGFSYLNQKRPFLHRLVPILADQFADIFPEVIQQQDFIKKIIEEEEQNFLNRLARGSQMFEEYMEKNSPQKVIEGSFAFELYDTYGFPLDLTELMAKENNWSVDQIQFQRLLDEQKNRSKDAAFIQVSDWQGNIKQAETTFVGYEQHSITTTILRHRQVKTTKGIEYQIILAETPFYAESGGQVGDTGTIVIGNQIIHVLDTKKELDTILHITDSVPAQEDQTCIATIDSDRRAKISANHSATHLLHAALRKVLGTHVEQRGSFVSDKLLRFDFSHYNKLSKEEITQVETFVNQRIADAIILEERRSVAMEVAKNMGAIALFGEKYGNRVRVIRFGAEFSTELCGGCHVNNTQEIRIFKIISESAIAAGIRRIEAVTHEEARSWYENQLEQIEQVKNILGNPQHLEKAIQDLQNLTKRQQFLLENAQHELMLHERDRLLTIAQTAPVASKYPLVLVSQETKLNTADAVKNLCFELRKNSKQSVFVIGAVINEKPLLSIVFSEDIVPTTELSAVQLAKVLSKDIQGGGGGQPFYATAGGKNIAGIPIALQNAHQLWS